MRWEIQLSGNRALLELLAEAGDGVEFDVRQDESGFHLSFVELESLDSADVVLERASRLVASLNGMTRHFSGETSDVKATSVTEHRKDGVSHVSVYFHEEMTLKSSLTMIIRNVDGSERRVGPEDAFITKAHLCAAHPDVSQAFRLYGQGELNWVDLYRVWEVVDRSGEGVVNQGWASKGQAKRFTRTSNHPDAAGLGARHGVSSSQPPPNPMTLREARAFLDSVLRNWLQSL